MLKVNEYFKGKVKSIALETASGKATVGVISPGEYEFSTSTREVMTIVTGKISVKLPTTNEWKYFTPGSSFSVESGLKFKVRAESDTGYLCLYI
jgi:Uncharacterized protein conserved in bacteria